MEERGLFLGTLGTLGHPMACCCWLGGSERAWKGQQATEPRAGKMLCGVGVQHRPKGPEGRRQPRPFRLRHTREMWASLGVSALPGVPLAYTCI